MFPHHPARSPPLRATGDSSSRCGETRRALGSPLEDIPQKALVRRRVDVRRGSVRTVARHFHLGMLCQHSAAALPAVVSPLCCLNHTPAPDAHVTACLHRGGAKSFTASLSLNFLLKHLYYFFAILMCMWII